MDSAWRAAKASIPAWCFESRDLKDVMQHTHIGLSILLWLPKFSWYINRNMPRLGRKMTTFRITSTENYHFRNHHDGKLSFSERPRRKITIFGTTSTENNHFRNYLDGKYTFSQPPRRKITIFTTTSTENYHFRNHPDGKFPFSESHRWNITIFRYVAIYVPGLFVALTDMRPK